MITRHRGWAVLGALAFWTASLDGAVLTVSSGPGEGQFQSIQDALDVAKAGDTVKVAKGVYQERVKFKKGGQKGAPVILEGEPGAIIDASTPVALQWQPAPDIGPGVYRTPLPFFPFTITADGKIITTLDEKRTSTTDKEPPPHGWKQILWREAFVNGIGPSKWKGVKALAMYRHAEKELLVRFQNELDPRQMTMSVAPKEPAVLVSGADRCVVRGFAIRNAAIGVWLEKTLGSVVEGCEIDPADFGVWLREGADRCTVRFNRIALHPYAGANANSLGAWDNWQATKVGGFYDRSGVSIGPSLGGHEVHDNYIHDHWDGICDFGNPPWGPKVDHPTDNTGLRIHHNRISNLADDGMETMGPSIDGQWHDNLIEKARCGFRIKAPQKGPLYIYRNIFFENKEDFRNWGSGEQLFPEAVVWVYHNTSTSDAAITMNYGTGPLAVTTPGYHFFNNLFWCLRWVDKSSKVPLPDWKGDYNVFVRVTPEAPRPWDSPIDAEAAAKNLVRWQDGIALAEKAGLDKHSTWVEGGHPGFADVAGQNVSLKEDSPARGRGIDLTSKSLPGCPAGYFQGSAPDAGALPFGEAMPVIPRPAGSVNQPAAGEWP